MEIKIKMRNHPIPTRLANTKTLKGLNDLIIAFYMEHRELSKPCWQVYKLENPTLKYNLAGFTKTEDAYSVRANNLDLDILPCSSLSHEAKGIDKGMVMGSSPIL